MTFFHTWLFKIFNSNILLPPLSAEEAQHLERSRKAVHKNPHGGKSTTVVHEKKDKCEVILTYLARHSLRHHAVNEPLAKFKSAHHEIS